MLYEDLSIIGIVSKFFSAYTRQKCQNEVYF